MEAGFPWADLVGTLVLVAVAACFALFMLYDRAMTDAGLMALTVACIAVIALADALRPLLGAIPARTLANAMFIVSGALGVGVIALRYRRPYPCRNVLLVTGAGALATAWFWWQAAPMEMAAAGAVVSALLFAQTVPLIARSERDALIDRLILWTGAVLAVLFAARAGLILLAGPEAARADRPLDLAGQGPWFAVFTALLTLFGLFRLVEMFIAFSLDVIGRLRAEATTDALTGLLNRPGFEAQAKRLMRAAERADVPVCLAVADIDRFKRVNDRHGHAAGDAVIRLFGDTLHSFLRASDATARIGGEEFTALLWNVGERDAGRVADAIRQAFAHSRATFDGRKLGATASFGVAEMRPGEAYEALFTRADAALYAAKRTRNVVCVAPLLSEEAVPVEPLDLARPGPAAEDLARAVRPGLAA